MQKCDDGQGKAVHCYKYAPDIRLDVPLYCNSTDTGALEQFSKQCFQVNELDVDGIGQDDADSNHPDGNHT